MQKRRADALLSGLMEALGPKAKSLIVTTFGDAILPRGGTCWLGSLIHLVEPFGLGDRLVRTSVFRLSKEEWLSSTAVGRRSLYSVTEAGRRRFDAADRRIYGTPQVDWNGEWTFVLADGKPRSSDAGEELGQQLRWMGFGVVNHTLFAHPASDIEDIRLLFQDLGIGQEAVIFRATAEPFSGGATMRALVERVWDLGQLTADYQSFLDLFRPVLATLSAAKELPEDLCFAVRILLVHEYRRIVLRDPMLPEELLPGEWAGSAAWLLARNLYRLTQGPAERYVSGILETADGPVPEPNAAFYARFGGLIEA